MTATATRTGFPLDPRSAAALYIGKDLAPIPLPARSKDPGYPDWPSLRLDLASLDRYFPTGEVCNVGILNGTPSHNRIDVDLDCAEARSAAALLLPPTGWIFGRKTSPSSHWIFETDLPLDTAQDEYKDLAGVMLVELRGTGGLTVYPPSLHKDTGERIAWERFTEPGQIKLADLQQVVGQVAAATLLARHWPAKGSRDASALALSGGLSRGGWSAEQVSRFVHAVAVAAGDEEARMRAGKAEPTARKQQKDKATTGWPKLAELLGEQGDLVVQRVREWLDLAPVVDLPIPEPAPWPNALAVEAYHGIAGELVRLLEPASEADPVAMLAQVLIAFGSMAGRAAYFVAESDRHYPNEFCVLVGATSKARKGSSWGRVECALAAIDESWEQRVQTGLSSGEGVVWWCRDKTTKREKIKKRGEPIRYEDVEADPGIADKRLLVLEPEFANVLQVIERHGNTLSATLRLAWDGRPLQTLAKNVGAKATGAHISVVGHVTADELRRLLTSTQAASGFGNRYLWVCAKRSKELPEGGRVDGLTLQQVRQRFADALTFARAQTEMRRDDDARELWRSVYGPLSDGKPGLSGALLARGEAHVMRLAMLYALLDCSSTIQAPHLLAALALWEYVDASVRYVFGDSLGDAVADDLLRLLRGCPGGLTRNDLMNYLGRHQSSERIGRALALLLQHKLVRCERQETRGRPAERWFACSKDHRQPT
jgi:hypothetical protein